MAKSTNFFYNFSKNIKFKKKIIVKVTVITLFPSITDKYLQKRI